MASSTIDFKELSNLFKRHKNDSDPSKFLAAVKQKYNITDTSQDDNIRSIWSQLKVSQSNTPMDTSTISNLLKTQTTQASGYYGELSQDLVTSTDALTHIKELLDGLKESKTGKEKEEFIGKFLNLCCKKIIEKFKTLIFDEYFLY